MVTTTKPLVLPTKGIDRVLGAKIADYVREDALAELIAVKDELVRRGYSAIDLALWGNLQISATATSWKSYERLIIPVGRAFARRPMQRNGSEYISLIVYWYVEEDLVGANWMEVEGA